VDFSAIWNGAHNPGEHFDWLRRTLLSGKVWECLSRIYEYNTKMDRDTQIEQKMSSIWTVHNY